MKLNALLLNKFATYTLYLYEAGALCESSVKRKEELKDSRNEKAHLKRWAFQYGACGRIRTSDRLVRSQVLYPAELHTR